MKTNTTIMRKISLALLSLSLIIALIALPMNMANHIVIPDAYAQTNAAMLNALAVNYSNIARNAAASSITITNTSTSTASNTIEGLQIKRDVNYFDSSSGYLVYPSAITGKKLPTVIMIHENRGLNDYIKSMANTLAREGYVVLAVDLFKGQVAQTNQQAQQLTSSVRSNPATTTSNLQAAVNYVSSLPFVDSSKIASIGWCFGGGQSLQLALHSEQHPLAATILYYGTPLVTDKQELSKIKWPVLGIFGDYDQANPVPLINSFKAALDADGITNQIQIYKGLGHAFANPSGANYAPQQTADAWQKTLAFLKKYV
ncbi:MAG TPA: dienelactone hydrolase family protein [Nitrososphaeraceae archaeon]|nr:dienelactone hydrolase family protein [Nitrososphaeraceae archaeon]